MSSNFKKVTDRWIKIVKVDSPDFKNISIHLTVRDNNNQPDKVSVKFSHEFLSKLDEYLALIIKTTHQLHSQNFDTEDKGLLCKKICVFVPGQVNSTIYELLLIADFMFKAGKKSYAFCIENGCVVNTIELE